MFSLTVEYQLIHVGMTELENYYYYHSTNPSKQESPIIKKSNEKQDP